MTFLQKLIWFAVIFFVSYILLIFNSPVIAGSIEKLLGFDGFNEFILSFKSTYDKTVTKTPTQEELIDTYNTVQSGAIEFKNNFGIGIDYTKKQIDEIRVSLSGAEDTYNDLKNGYNETKEFINTNSGKIQYLRDTIESFSGITDNLSNTGIINGIQEGIENIIDISNNITNTGSTN